VSGANIFNEGYNYFSLNPVHHSQNLMLENAKDGIEDIVGISCCFGPSKFTFSYFTLAESSRLLVISKRFSSKIPSM
jgi:hypothetical protein